MKTILSIITFLAFISASAQTPIIAHKSHAGSAVSFFIDPSSNFGEIYIPPTIYQEAITENFVHWELLDDSTIVKQVMDSNQRVISVDYISNKEKLSIDYFKYQFDMKQQRIRDSIYYDNYLKEQEKNEKKQNSILPIGKPNSPNTPSLLLICLLVSAVGMIILRLFNRKEMAIA